ncbi:helix-turn-helix domain-containing protein [Bacillus sp. RO2]|jgi:XRE family transcriptional regulator of biofilm formation|uniref:helix-turn-helix domain-containing protein n=1 Tax=Bacillus sp. RO2 TaxID=2723913 RepID=UPI00145F5E62|nr:helix-turn-helix domain-containing protein [Bacillus sp. RO2]NMH75281.1 helix-turn-helix domain-containing protein [Bacillus sp. RO2]
MIGERIRKLRKSKGYSLSELAEKAGVSKSYLSYLERDLQTNPSLQFLQKISISLGTNIEYLLDGRSTEKKLEQTRLVVDEEWKKLIQKAIKEGMTKEDFVNYRNYLQFQKWQSFNRKDSKEDGSSG